MPDKDEKEATGRTAKLVGLLASEGGLAAVVLYAVGYLALRHQLNVLAIETSLKIVDERYLFEGARAMVHMLVSLPQLVLVLLPPSLFAYAVYRRWAGLRTRIGRVASAVGESGPRLVLVALVFSTLVVQFVMRQPFQLSDLLLRTELPRTAWLRSLVLDQDGTLLALYLGGMVIAAGISVVLCHAAWKKTSGAPASFFWLGLLSAVVAVQVMLLPINYGILTAGREVPRVALPEAPGIDAGQELWRIWETKEELVLLARTPAPKTADGVATGRETRRLMTVERKKAGRIDTLCIDPLVRLLYTGARSGCSG